MRIKQRIMLKFLISLNGYDHRGYNDRRTTLLDTELGAQCRKIIQLFFTLAAMDAEAISKDTFLMMEWVHFIDKWKNSEVDLIYTLVTIKNSERS